MPERPGSLGPGPHVVSLLRTGRLVAALLLAAGCTEGPSAPAMDAWPVGEDARATDGGPGPDAADARDTGIGQDSSTRDTGTADAEGPAPSLPQTVDPGTGPWQPVPRAQVAAVCGLDPELLDVADAWLGRRWGVVRYGKLCHEYYPGEDTKETAVDVYSATKTLGAVVFGRAAYETRHLVADGPGTGPLSALQRVDHWIDPASTSFDIHPDAAIAHVLAMVAYSDDLGFGQKVQVYDNDGTREVNSLNDILRVAIQQDGERLGTDLEAFVQRFVFAPLGMQASSWGDGAADKDFSTSWVANIRDMLRLGLLVNNGGVWNGERLVSAQYLYEMIHPAFEDGNTGYGYLTWVNAADHRVPYVSDVVGTVSTPQDTCAPRSLHRSYPHGLSAAPDCHYTAPGYGCEQTHDVGTWNALGLDGHHIYGHRGLDLVIAVQDMGTLNLHTQLWSALRPALVAEDPAYANDEAGFCEAYAAGEYAPDLQLWEGGL